MAILTSDVVQGTIGAVALAVLTQAVENRAPTAEQADQYSAAVAGAGAALGLYLMHRNDEGGRGAASHELGEGLWYAGLALLGAEGVRYVDHRLAASAAAKSAAMLSQVRAPQTAVSGPPPVSRSVSPALNSLEV